MSLNPIADGVRSFVAWARSVWDTELEFGWPPRRGGGNPTRTGPGEGGATHDTEFRSGRPFPDPVVIDRGEFGKRAEWLPLAHFILNAYWEGSKEHRPGGRKPLHKFVEEVSGHLSDLSDPRHDAYVSEVAAYLKDEDLNPAGRFNEGALRRLRDDYEEGRFGPPDVARWW